MKLPPFNSQSGKEGNRLFYTTKLSIDEIINNINQTLENIYVGDDREMELPPDEESERAIANRVPADTDYKIKRLRKWDDDAYQIKKDAKNQTEEGKINAIRKWIGEKIEEYSGKKPTVRVLALYYVYLHNSKEYPAFQIITKKKNKKDAFSAFAEEHLKLGKSSLLLKYGLFDNVNKRRANASINEMQAVIKMLADNNYPKALATAKQEFRMIELRK